MPPVLDAAMAPVNAPLVIADERPPVGAVVAVSGPVAMMSLFSGDSGSTVGSTSSTRYLLPRPRWPR